VAIALGIDPRVYLRAKDHVELAVIAEAMRQAQKARQQEIEAIGIACANALAKMFKKR
jgi:hypothetical protein